ncbi:MAG: GNAT family N-acetyltransferase [Flavisolibacter sp.]|jgi:putative acetyltransferase|nr:GNAT family N-acetyltransferase [Flavisolibacter sp.]
MEKIPPTIENSVIRNIRKEDNHALANVIRNTLEEFGAHLPGTVYYDPTTDALFELFKSDPRSVYFVATIDQEIVGGGGIFPSPGLPEDTCELVKMYLLKKARGIGLGKTLIERSLSAAKDQGFKKVYLESMPQLKQALKTYEKFGFHYLDGPMGATGHFGCGLWMMKDIS